MEPYIFLRCEGKTFPLTNAKARAKHSFSALKTLNQFLYVTEKLEKHLELPYVPKRLRISDQAIKTTSFTQAAIFVYFTGGHVSGIWVLGK